MANGRDLDILLASVNAASAKARAAWIALLSFGTYLAIAVGSTTHRDLFLESPLELPLLGVELPIVAFYVVAPFLFLVMHLYLLLSLYVLGRRVQLFDAALPSDADQEQVRARLEPFLILQKFAGRVESAVTRILLVVTVWLTVVAAPVVLLIAFQVQFLPYHSALVTWWHRGLIAADLVLICLLWASTLHPSGRIGPALAAPFMAGGRLLEAIFWYRRRPEGGWTHTILQTARGTASQFACVGVLVFSFLAATVPDEGIEEWLIRGSGLFTTVPPEARHPGSSFVPRLRYLEIRRLWQTRPLLK